MSDDTHLLREYVVTLQSKLLEVAGRFPMPPEGLRLYHQPAPPADRRSERAPSEENHHTSINDGTPLEYVARAVANIAAQDLSQLHQPYADDQEMGEDHTSDDTRTADEINRHLQSEDVKAERAAEV